MGVDSLIPLADGSRKRVADVRPGDAVLSLCEDLKIRPARVLASLDMGLQDLYKVVTKEGRVIEVTAEHPLLSPGGWRRMDTFLVGDFIGVPSVILPNGQNIVSHQSDVYWDDVDVHWDTIGEIAPLGPAATWDLSIEGTANFIADDIFAHNTILGPWWLKRKIDELGGGDYYAITATYDLFNLKMLPALLQVFETKLGMGHYWGGTTRVLEIADPDGRLWAKKSTDPMWARIILRSADSKGGLESGTVKAAWLDEAGQDRFTLAAWRAVRRRLSLYQGDVLISTTLFNLGWLKQQIIDPAKEGGATELTVLPRGGAEIEVTDSPAHDIRLVQFDSIVNPMFPIEEYEEARRTMPADEFAMFYRGRVARLRTLIYDVFDETIGVNVVNSFPIPAHWPKAVGIDPIGAEIGALWIALDPELQQVHVYREYLAPFGETTAGHANNILGASTGERIDVWAGGGPSERQARTDWSAAGIPLMDPPNIPVWSGIERVYSLVKPRALVVHKCCAHLLSEMGSYQRLRDRAGNLTDQIKDKEQFHLLDCLRYIIATVTEPYPDGEVKYANMPQVRIGY